MQRSPAQVPFASSMVEFAAQARDPRQAYICHWTAFHVLYTAIATQAGLRPSFSLRRNGTRITRRVGAVKISQVTWPSESDQIATAYARFDTDLKHALIVHRNTPFFVYRVPTWQGTAIERDALGQRLNGVIDVGRTLDPRYPVWSPIDIQRYRQYTTKSQDDGTRDTLARQLLDVLCTVHSNLLYGAACADEESSPHIVGQALPLLAKVVTHLLSIFPKASHSP